MGRIGRSADMNEAAAQYYRQVRGHHRNAKPWVDLTRDSRRLWRRRYRESLE